MSKDPRCKYSPFQTRGRFYIENMGGEWCVIDELTSKLVGFETQSQAREAASFARAYVKRHGDIDLGSFPYGLDDKVHYEDDPNDQRPFKIIDGTVKWLAVVGGENVYL